jgi:hypothetical protein
VHNYVGVTGFKLEIPVCDFRQKVPKSANLAYFDLETLGHVMQELSPS